MTYRVEIPLFASRRQGYAAHMRKRSSIKSTDLHAEKIVQEVTLSAEQEPTKNPAAVALGRLGGLKGGKARAGMLSPDERAEIASKAALARWGKRGNR